MHWYVVHVVLGPCHTPKSPRQSTSVTFAAHSVPKQQAPTAASGHGFGLHEEAAPSHVPPDDVHWSLVKKVQLPSESQQAPDGGRHGFGVHLVPTPWKVPPVKAQSSGQETSQV